MATLMLPLEVHEHTVKCGTCGGTGVTGDRYDMEAGEHTLTLEVICPQCGGCGNGDPGHRDCIADWHAYPEDVLGIDGLEPLMDVDEMPCPSCQSGRGWYPVQGFTGEGDDAEIHILRTLCGCSTDRLVPAE
jgi:hypothetical protein